MPNLLLQAYKTPVPAGGTRPSGLTALQWYKLNETSSPAANSGTGAGSPLVGYGSTTWGQPLSTLTWADKSVQFNDGTTDYLQSAIDTDILAGTGAWTIELWTYLTGSISFSFGSAPYLTTRQNLSTFNSQWVVGWINGNTLQVFTTVSSYLGNQGSVQYFTAPYYSQVQNQICYWVFTCQSSSSYPDCYLNGVALPSAGVSGFTGTVAALSGANTSIGPNGTNPYAKSIVGQYSNFIVNNAYTPVATALARYNAAFP